MKKNNKETTNNRYTGLKNNRYWVPDPDVPETLEPISGSKKPPEQEVKSKKDRISAWHPNDYH